MSRYYADLREELEEQRRRHRDKDEADDRLAARRMAIDREEQVRVAELRQKSTLRVHQRLIQVVVIQQPKLLIHAQVSAPAKAPVEVELVWDPLSEALEAIPCSECQRPTYTLALGSHGGLVCPACAERSPEAASRKKSINTLRRKNSSRYSR